MNKIFKLIKPFNNYNKLKSKIELGLQYSINSLSNVGLRPLYIKKYFCSAAAQLYEDLQIGNQIHGFSIKNVEDVPELHLKAIRLKHIKTGADYLHIARNDSNNVFCVGFRTTPMDSTGVPHILEHSVLCGSEKFPCRDPFFKMLNRSLSTFMNAMTGSDYTIYPFSTQNAADFNNLMGVYMDATFKPNLEHLDFLQEGWRLEHEDPNDDKSPILIKGVVFNEMKGVFADSQNIFLQSLQNGLMPSHTYGYISGGDPLCIPELTWTHLKEFHAKHYHPSNSRFFTYGDQPLENHLNYINSNYLSKFEECNFNTIVPSETKWNEPRKSHITCGIDQMAAKEKQSNIAVSYLLSDITDVNESFMMAIIGELLMGGPNAPFYKSLIETQYGTSFSPGSGFDGHTKTTSFTVGLQGVDPENFDDICKAIDKTFAEAIDTGFPAERIQAVLHSIELGIKHQSSSFGLALAMSLTPIWNHGGDLIEVLKINRKLIDFKNILQNNPEILQEKIKQNFQINKHKFTLSMSPDASYEENSKKAETEILNKKVNDLTDEERKRIYETGQVLKSKQELKEDISCLPTLKVTDIARNKEPTITQQLTLGESSVPLQLCEQPTNGVTYFRAVLDMTSIPDELRHLIPLFTGVLTEMGAGTYDFRSFSQQIELVSGGLDTSVHITGHPAHTRQYEEGITLASHCLSKNVSPMLELWTQILNDVKMDDLSRFTTLVKMMAADQTNSLVQNGHSYAMSYSASSIDYLSHIKEQWGGLTNMKAMKKLSESSDLSETLHNLKRMADLVFKGNKLRIAVNASPEDAPETLKHVEIFLTTLDCHGGNSGTMRTVPKDFIPDNRGTHHVFPFPVNFAAKSFLPSLAYAHADSGASRVLAQLMFQFLHREIREKGGAYGGGASSSPGGPFCFYSYRDPHSTRTLRTFDDSIDWVLGGEFTQRDVDEAKLGVFKKLDSPLSPGAKGLRNFFAHITQEMYNEHRESILDADRNDLIRVCRNYLKENDVKSSCLIGPANEDIEKDSTWIKILNDNSC